MESYYPLLHVHHSPPLTLIRMVLVFLPCTSNIYVNKEPLHTPVSSTWFLPFRIHGQIPYAYLHSSTCIICHAHLSLPHLSTATFHAVKIMMFSPFSCYVLSFSIPNIILRMLIEKPLVGWHHKPPLNFWWHQNGSSLLRLVLVFTTHLYRNP
jgi:hypothetical protein